MPSPARRFHQPLAAAIVKPRVGGKANRLCLYGRIHIDALQLRGANGAHLDPRLDGRAQHLFGPGLAQSLAPARHAGRLDRQSMLKELLPAEVLPVRVLDPMRHHVFVAQIVLVLQIVQRHHQPRGDARRALRGMIRRTQRQFKGCPIDAHPQLNQRVTQVNQLFQFHLEQLTLRLLRLSLRAHNFPQNMWRFELLSGIIIPRFSDICY